MFKNKNWFFMLVVMAFLSLITSCTPYRLAEKIPAGTHRKRMVFRSEPTPSDIFINDNYLGRTPVKTDLWYLGTRRLTVRAQPLYPTQYPQNIVVKIPKVPAKMTIFMDYNPMKDFTMRQKEAALGAAEAGEAGAGGEVEELTFDSLKDTIIIKEPIPLPLVYFDFDKYYLRESEMPKIDPIVELLLKNPLYKLTIHGHADERGTVVYNKELSTNRALTVYNYMLDHDIEPDRMRIYGHGELTIIEEDGYKLEYQNDRIVTFRLHYKEFPEPSLED